MHSRKWLMLLWALLCILSLVTSILPLHAAGETYVLTTSPNRTQETNTPGVILSLSVTNAQVGANYKFTFHVTDPAGNLRNSGSSVNLSPSSFVTNVTYPTSFGASVIINYVGYYAVVVDQTGPTTQLNVATGVFLVGLTDATTYQRTLPVYIKALGYLALENVTISITSNAGPAPGFPRWQRADGSGTFSYVWQSIPAATSLGTYRVTLTGASTLKNPPDTQTLNIVAATVAIPQLTISLPTLQASETESFQFGATYPNGTQVQNGSASIRIVEADGTTSHQTTATYNTILGVFNGTYQAPLNGNAGVWVASINQGSFNDGYGNTGPPVSVSTQIYVVVPQSSTSNYLLLAVIILLVASAILVSWFTFFRRRRILRSVLKVDLQVINAEAKKVENLDFFKKLQEQLEQQKKKKRGDDPHG